MPWVTCKKVKNHALWTTPYLLNMLGKKKDEDNGLSGVKYEVALLKTAFYEFQEAQKEQLNLLRQQIAKLASDGIVTSRAIIEGTPFEIIDAEELDAYTKKVKGIVLDVRTETEWQQGHIKGAVHIPIHSLESRAMELTDKDRSIFLLCSSGERSLAASKTLIKKGFSSVFQVQGGLSRYPGKLVKEKTEELASQ